MNRVSVMAATRSTNKTPDEKRIGFYRIGKPLAGLYSRKRHRRCNCARKILCRLLLNKLVVRSGFELPKLGVSRNSAADRILRMERKEFDDLFAGYIRCRHAVHSLSVSSGICTTQQSERG